MVSAINATSTAAALLLVEDNDDHAELISRALARSNRDIRLCRARDSDEAKSLLAAASASELTGLAAIVVDVRLPKQSGLELIADLKTDPRTRDIPAVVLTSSQEPGDIRAAYEARANSYLVKPTRPAGFSTLMRDLATYWSDHNQRPSSPSC